MVNVGVIGVGNMGRHHVYIYLDLKEADLVGICDADSDLAQKMARQFNVKSYERIGSLLRDIEAVSIATLTSTHKDIALKAIQSGIHLLVEKLLRKAASLPSR